APEVLVRLGLEAGLAEDAIRSLLAGTDFAEEVRADIGRGRQLGVTGVPFFVIDSQHGLSGAQPPEVFLSALEQLGPQEPKLNMLGGSGITCTDDGCTTDGA
ncbi:MAG TPA: DsbA family protein, partial [Deinococcales bacterium]|nr:DsbA family protein [Deinococcales bacterium]